MNDVRIIEGWQELEVFCASIGWYATISNNQIALHSCGITALRTTSMEAALGFIQGYIAGTKESK